MLVMMETSLLMVLMERKVERGEKEEIAKGIWERKSELSREH